jgi:nucleoside 2-deoxyribosyltransferase
MKIYLASKSTMEKQVREVSEELKKQGHQMTVEWWDFPKARNIVAENDELWFQHKHIQWICDRDLKAVESADILILVANADEETRFDGANVELGYAMALGKPCISVGKITRSAMYAQIHRCGSITELVSHVKYLESRFRSEDKCR